MLSVGDFSLQEVSVRSVGSVGYSSPTDCTGQHRWLVALVRPRNPQNSQKFGCVSGCVGTAGCHTLLHLCKSVLSVGDPSLQEASVRSVGSVGVPLLAWLVQQRELHPLRLHQCHLWKSLLSKKFLCVPWVLWEYSSPTDFTDSHRWLGALVVAWVRQDAIPSYTMGSEMPCIF